MDPQRATVQAGLSREETAGGAPWSPGRALATVLVGAWLGLVPSRAAAQDEVWRAPVPEHPGPGIIEETEREPAPPGQAALDHARSAWDKGDYDVAEPLYAEALEKGGLGPQDVLEAYVHLGSARAVLGKKAAALVAFKSAALLDVRFAVPPDAGKRAVAVAEQARKATRTGPVVLRATAPEHIPPDSIAMIDVTLDPAHAALAGSRLGVSARSDTSTHPFTDSVRASRTAHFDLPASLSLPSTTLHVRVDWLDTHANRLASAEEQVHVQPLPNTAPMAPLPISTVSAHHPPEEAKHRGFWHTAWPYVIGSVALAAGGAAIYFATRTPDAVNVSGARVMAQ